MFVSLAAVFPPLPPALLPQWRKEGLALLFCILQFFALAW